MRSIFGTIFLRFSAMIVLSFLATFVTRIVVTRTAGSDSPTRLLKLQLQDARAAYERGGSPELSSYLARAAEAYGSQFFMVDETGKDLVTGEDRSSFLIREKSSIQIPYLGHTSQRRTLSSSDKKFSLVNVSQRHFNLPEFLSYYAWTFLSILVLSWWIAMDLGSPVRKLRLTVERFGQGDLSARIDSKRTDELGDLAKAFDHMSGRIQALLTSERRLLQDISHELRSPLARLSCAIELARTTENRDEAIARIHIARIHKESRRLNSLVGQLLEVASAEGDPAAMRRDPVDLVQLVAEIVDEGRIEAEAKRCWLTFGGGVELEVRGDSELLRRAFENVLRNAIRYAPDGTAVEVQLTIRDRLACLTIRDYGKGVPGEFLSDIFKPFFRVESHRGDQGVGLGLALAQRAIGLHPGTVRAENSSPGLMITIELPVEVSGSPVDTSIQNRRTRFSLSPSQNL